MKVLILGDIFGRPGRRIVKEQLPKILSEESVDLTIANVENIAGGKGITDKTLAEMAQSGIDLFTGGNHIFDNLKFFQADSPLIQRLARPLNLPGDHPGLGVVEYRLRNGAEVLLINLLGRVFMNALVDCPFQILRQTLQSLAKDYAAIFVDFHAEATSEKAAFRHYFTGQVTAIWGTHTHVATCDWQIDQNGTFFVTDLGMIGPTNSIIGLKIDAVLPKFLEAKKMKMEVASGETILQGFFLDIEDKKVQNIKRLSIIST
jgi:metallophosphoesterase (TIGR00282 family)